eukprot:scaffold205245_cov15-Tisochrysis_lutea.AAC.1
MAASLSQPDNEALFYAFTTLLCMTSTGEFRVVALRKGPIIVTVATLRQVKFQNHVVAAVNSDRRKALKAEGGE